MSLLDALNVLQSNIKALQNLVPVVTECSTTPMNEGHAVYLQRRHAMASAEIASIISQMAVTAAGVLPTIAEAIAYTHTLQTHERPSHPGCGLTDSPKVLEKINVKVAAEQVVGPTELLAHGREPTKDKEDYCDEVHAEDSLEIMEMDPCEILAEHSHFCEICGKGFKRDANLRMHMRGHGDQYKSLSALSGPDKALQEFKPIKPKRYSCPFEGCKRNKAHKKFLPLKTMLCVKNHYRRTHCAKLLTCGKCKDKSFAVVADLKTHEKHCGKDKWMCSCGTSFSRKDKLLGHLKLFVGHVPARAPQGEGNGIFGSPWANQSLSSLPAITEASSNPASS